MKPTPLYELSVAIKDRPKIFRIIVTACFFFSFSFSIFRLGDMALNENDNKKRDNIYSHNLYKTKASIPSIAFKK